MPRFAQGCSRTARPALPSGDGPPTRRPTRRTTTCGPTARPAPDCAASSRRSSPRRTSPSPSRPGRRARTCWPTAAAPSTITCPSGASGDARRSTASAPASGWCASPERPPRAGTCSMRSRCSAVCTSCCGTCGRPSGWRPPRRCAIGPGICTPRSTGSPPHPRSISLAWTSTRCAGGSALCSTRSAPPCGHRCPPTAPTGGTRTSSAPIYGEPGCAAPACAVRCSSVRICPGSISPPRTCWAPICEARTCKARRCSGRCS